MGEITDLTRLTNNLQDQFENLDINEDGLLSKNELANVSAPGLNLLDRHNLLRQIAKSHDDQDGPETDISRNDILHAKLNAVADRLTNIFGKDVSIKNLNGTDFFFMDAGSNLSETEAIVDKLVEVRTQIGLNKENLTFYLQEDGAIAISGKDILNYSSGESDVKDHIFDKLERKEITERIQACFKNDKFELKNILHPSDVFTIEEGTELFTEVKRLMQLGYKIGYGTGKGIPYFTITNPEGEVSQINPSVESNLLDTLKSIKAKQDLSSTIPEDSKPITDSSMKPTVEIPSNLTRMVPLNAARWAQLQSDIALNTIQGNSDGLRLVDASNFMTNETSRALSVYLPEFQKQDQQTGLQFSNVNEDGFKFAFKTNDNQTWYLSETPNYRDQYPNGVEFSETSLVLRKKSDNGLTQIEIPASEAFSNGRINYHYIQSKMREAEQNRDSETNFSELQRIRELDLPKDRLIGYIGLVDSNKSDPVILGIKDDVKRFPEMMNGLRDSQGNSRYNFVSTNNSESISVSRAPFDILAENIQAMHDQGVTDFYINVAGHGNQEGIFFERGGMNPFGEGNYFKLTANDLCVLFDRFPDCKFRVDTVACLGGGLADGIKQYNDSTGEDGRVIVKLQSKQNSINQEGRLSELTEDGINKPHSSYYNVFYAQSLQLGLTEGSAHLRADMLTKRYGSSDAEIWTSGPRGGSAVKGFNLRN